jgi:hypothetical protein
MIKNDEYSRIWKGLWLTYRYCFTFPWEELMKDQESQYPCCDSNSIPSKHSKMIAKVKIVWLARQ